MAYTIHTDENMRTFDGELEDVKTLARHFAAHESSKVEVTALVTLPWSGRNDVITVFRYNPNPTS